MADTYVISQHADHSGASINNGGGYTANYTEPFASLHDEGADLITTSHNSSDNACTWDDTTGTIGFAGIGDVAEVGMLVHVIWETTQEEDWFEVLTVSSSNAIIISNDGTNYYSTIAGSETKCDCWVGGLFSIPSDPYTNGIVDAGDTLYAVTATYVHTGATIYLTADVDGTTTAPVSMIGVNEFGVDDGSIVTLEMNNSSAAINRAIYCDSDYNIFKNIKIKGMEGSTRTTSGIYILSQGCTCINMEVEGLVYGYFVGTNNGRPHSFINCNVGANVTSIGFYMACRNGRLHNCKVLSESTYGIMHLGLYGLTINHCIISGPDYGIHTLYPVSVDNSTIYNCGVAGVYLASTNSNTSTISNTTISGCKDGSSCAISGIASTGVNLHNVNMYDNDTDVNTTNVTVWTEDSPVTTDPKFVSAATNDFSLKSTSPLLLDDGIIGDVGLTDIPLLSAVLDTATLGGELGTASEGSGGGGRRNRARYLGAS